MWIQNILFVFVVVHIRHANTLVHTVTIMYCGIQKCLGQQASWYASAATQTISEMKNNNLLLFCPLLSKVSHSKEWEQKQTLFCAGWYAVAGVRLRLV